MFTRHDKIKERIMFFVPNQQQGCEISKNLSIKPVDVSFVMTYKYVINNMEIVYNKWFVESFELAKSMNLLGCDQHDKLVSGSGVYVSTKDLGVATFYGKDALDIINACESGRSM